MTDQEINIKIAEACGWRWCDDEVSNKGFYVHDQRADGLALTEDDLPNYCRDLNAMHEAEKVLDDGVLWGGYLNRLWEVVCPQFEQMSGLNAAVGLLLVHATARQRAEAFLKTLNLWKD